jgi:hypothetical protein
MTVFCVQQKVVHCFDVFAKKAHETLLGIGCVPGAGDTSVARPGTPRARQCVRGALAA